MKNIIITLFIALGSIAVQAQEIKWMTLDEALKAQEKKPKKIFMDVYTDWCGPCKMLDKNTFQNKDVADFINKNYYAVKFNAEGNQEVTYKGKKFGNPSYDAKRTGRNSMHDLTQALKVNGYPSMVFFDEKGEYIFPLVGYYTPTQIEIYLKVFAKDKHKELTSKELWEKYQASFKNEFKS
ncbi:thioredoxin family protein [Flavobacterium sp. '19STA2R22 D10 B1']|uniref:thioredoxin family protein n=1 Tax=Flavobacterium aerium TaxID=3037261 RepID=UPI00278C60C7|nr:thioredoxin fold domain-containing protein [Flavobacterium sp. '19STA2R22 D10 B1']